MSWGRPLVVGAVLLALVTIVAILTITGDSGRRWSFATLARLAVPTRKPAAEDCAAADAHQYEAKNWLLGPPTQRYRANLRGDVKYMTANDFMTYINLIYLAHITRPHVPVIGPFHPVHVGPDAGFLYFGTLFDIPRLSAQLRLPVLEWHQVKDASSTQIDELGCWSAWQVTGGSGRPPVRTSIETVLGIDVSYTAAPGGVKLRPGRDLGVKFWALAALLYPEGRAAALKYSSAQPSQLRNTTHLPDEHMACYDFLYYAAVETPYEWNSDYSPAWREVGVHTHFAPAIRALAEGYLMRHFGVQASSAIPPFIAVHVRHGDFKGACSAALEECFAPLAVYARRVDEVRAELIARHGVSAEHVLVTSDERDPEWWAQVKALGWRWVDHDAEKTIAVHGKWYPTILDGVIPTMSRGFVGTDRSTFSNVARRRVEDWMGGPTRMVKWGRPGSDEHRRRHLWHE